MTELRKGTSLHQGKYTIEQKLGQGSFGITYLASTTFSVDGSLGKMEVSAPVCIKEFFMSDVNSRNSDGSSIGGSDGSIFTNYRYKFRKEAENLSKLSHSCIVRVIDIFDENNTTYYVMEYLEGENLDDYLRSQGQLPEREAISIIREIGGALQYMHSRKMLHLDIKPKNVMHCTDGTNRLIDFGLSKQYSADGEPESSTSIGLGTPGYAPLEQSQFIADGTFPATLDVYALGATMYKLLCGQRPPQATEIFNDGFPADVFRDLSVSEKTIEALRVAMHPARKKRWQTVADFLNALPEDNNEENTVIVGSDKTKIKDRIKAEKVAVSESDEEPTFAVPRTLVAIWKSRNIVTNLICVAGLALSVVTLIYIACYTNYLSEIIIFCGVLSILAGIVNTMYEGRRLLSLLPLLIIPLCGVLQWTMQGGNDTYLKIALFAFTPAYAVMIAPLFLKKNGVSAWEEMKKREKLRKLPMPEWPVATTFISWFIAVIVAVSLFGLATNYRIAYYRFGFLEVLLSAYCLLLIGLKQRIGLFLMPLMLALSYIVAGYVTYCTYIVEICILVSTLIETASLFLFRRHGKNAWQMMR